MGAVIALAVCYFVFGILGSYLGVYTPEAFSANYWSDAAFVLSVYIAWAALYREIHFDKNRQKWETR